LTDAASRAGNAKEARPHSDHSPRASEAAETTRSQETSSYAVGYGKPPKHTQFRKGQSGNPKGRSRGSRNTQTIFEEESRKLVAVTENGKTQKLTKRELVLKTIINKAARGDEKAQVKFLKLDERFSAERQRLSGSAEVNASSDQTIEELTAADRIILELHRSMQDAGSTEKRKETEDPDTSGT